MGRFRSTIGVKTFPKPEKSGYVRVKVKGQHHLLHRLIATAFDLPRLPNATQVHHKDNDPSMSQYGRRERAHRAHLSHSLSLSLCLAVKSILPYTVEDDL